MIPVVKEQVIKGEKAALGIHFMKGTGVKSDFKGMRGRQITEISHLIPKLSFKVGIGGTVIPLENDQIRVETQGDVPKANVPARR